MFRTVFPSIIRSLRLYIQHQVYVIQVLWLLASKATTEPVWHDAVCTRTVLDSWWWTERPSETCRVLFQNKINLRYCASGWFYYRNILRCTVLQTSDSYIFIWNCWFYSHSEHQYMIKQYLTETITNTWSLSHRENISHLTENTTPGYFKHQTNY